jgi:hypothetical protein
MVGDLIKDQGLKSNCYSANEKMVEKWSFKGQQQKHSWHRTYLLVPRLRV